MRLRLFAVAILLAGSLSASDPELLSLAMPDSQLMAGINVEQVSLSPIGQYLLAQSGAQSDAGLQKLIDTTGFDPRHDLREILVSSNGQPGANSGIILVRGTFNVPKIVEAALADGETIETYKGVQIVQWKGKQDQSLAFVDSTLAIAGNPVNVRAAIDRKASPTSVGSALAVAVNTASTTQDAWFVSLVPPTQWQPNPKVEMQGPFAILNKVQQASGGIKFGASVVVMLKAVLPTAADASALADLLKSLVGIAQLGAGNEQAAAAAVGLLQNLQVSADGVTTKVSLTVPEQQLEQLFKPVPGK